MWKSVLSYLWIIWVFAAVECGTFHKAAVVSDGIKLYMKADCDARLQQSASLETICGDNISINVTNIGDASLTVSSESVEITWFWADRCRDSITEDEISDPNNHVYQSSATMTLTHLDVGMSEGLDDLYSGTVTVDDKLRCIPACIMGAVRGSSDTTWTTLAGGEAPWVDEECGTHGDFNITVEPVDSSTSPIIELQYDYVNNDFVYYANFWDFINQITVSVDNYQNARPDLFAHAVTVYLRPAHDSYHKVINYDHYCGEQYPPEIGLSDEVVTEFLFTDAQDPADPFVINSAKYPDRKLIFDNKTCAVCGQVSMILQLDVLHMTKDPNRCNNYVIVNATVNCPDDMLHKTVVQAITEHTTHGDTTHFRRCNYGLYEEPKIFTRKSTRNVWRSQYASEMDDTYNMGMMRSRVYARRSVNQMTSEGNLDEKCAALFKADSEMTAKRLGASADVDRFSDDCHHSIHEAMTFDQSMRDESQRPQVIRGIIEHCPPESQISKVASFYLENKEEIENGTMHPGKAYDLGDYHLLQCPTSDHIWDLVSTWHLEEYESITSPVHQLMMFIGSESQRRLYVHSGQSHCSEEVVDPEICGYRALSHVMMTAARIEISYDISERIQSQRYWVDLKEGIKALYEQSMSVGGSKSYSVPSDEELSYLDYCERPDPLKPGAYIPVYHKVVGDEIMATSDASVLGKDRYCWQRVGKVHCPYCHHYSDPGYSGDYSGSSGYSGYSGDWSGNGGD